MSLKVFDLQCEHGHVFEGWFASSDAFESQKAGGLLSCPVCQSVNVTRKLSAARLNVGHLKRERLGGGRPDSQSQAMGEAGVPSGTAEQMPAGIDPVALQAEMIRQVRKILKETENVGDRFAEESRRIHYGDAEERAIRGTATLQERLELAEEGIAVQAIPDIFDDDRLQ